MPTGELDRKALASRVFSDAEARARLNAITHPLIAAETVRRMQALAARGVEIAFYEAALLVETGAQRSFAGLIVVESDAATQCDRVAGRDGLSADEVARRMSAQLSNETRRAAADVVIPNDGSLELLRSRVDALWQKLRREGRSPP